MMTLGGAAMLTGVYSWLIEPHWVEFVRLRMPVKNLPKRLVGMTVMQISDIHVGNSVDRSYLIRAFKEANEYYPDYVVYTGDFLSYSSDEQFGELNEIMDHAVYGRAGTVGVLGNHDYGSDWSQNHVADKIQEILGTKGIHILRNEQLDVNGLTFIGFDDYWGPNFRPHEVMNNWRGSKANILLCHNPDVADEDVWNGYDGWILAGHTHGGQFRPPYMTAPITPVKNKKYIQGRIAFEDGRIMYVNRALGHLVQLRLNVRPEITIFELMEG